MSYPLDDNDRRRDDGATSCSRPGVLKHLQSWLVTRWQTLITAVWSRFMVSLTQSATYARANMVYFAVLEIVGQPLYYYLWSDVYPQPYENVWLRAICVVVALPMLFEPRISQLRNIEGWVAAYWLLALLFELPFFFFLMTLLNNVSAVWALSSLASLMLLVILVFDWLMTFLLLAAGASLACLALLAMGGNFDNAGDIPLPVLVFTYLFGAVVGSTLNYKSELVAREKLAAITDAMGTMAHELRTPLLGIQSGARGLSTYVPTLLAGYEMARAHDLPVKPIRRAHFRQMQSVLERIQAESEFTSAVLDMLLVNSDRASIDRSAFESISAGDCVRDALDRYPFHSARERAWVHWHDALDFRFIGSRVLMVHVLFNLLKNALYHLTRTERGEITIWAEWHASGVNRLHFRDTGPGIPPDALRRIFERFYTNLPRGQGTGIGLAFVHRVIDSFGGHIRCDSVLGEYTEFTMSFPEPDRNGQA